MSSLEEMLNMMTAVGALLGVEMKDLDLPPIPDMKSFLRDAGGNVQQGEGRRST